MELSRRELLGTTVKYYWARSADENLKTAMEKIRATVRSAMA